MTLFTIAHEPLSSLWLLAGIAVAGGIAQWLLGGTPWEGFGAAGVIAGVTQLAARAKGVRAWPWLSPPGSL